MQKFIKSGDSYQSIKSDVIVSKLQGVFLFKEATPVTPNHLERVGDNFEVSNTINLYNDIVDLITISYQNNPRNSNALFVGTKGSGKSYLAKIISNKLNLPAIIVDINTIQDIDNTVQYLQSLEIPAVVLIDEFDKINSEWQLSFISLLDGVNDFNSNKLYIFTANEAYKISDVFLDRPSRIKFLVPFTNLSYEEVYNIIVNSGINEPEIISKIVKYIIERKYITIDLVLSILKEIKLLGVKYLDSIFKYFNASTVSENTFNFIKINKTDLLKLPGLKNKLSELDPYDFIQYLADNQYYKKVLSSDNLTYQLRTLDLSLNDYIVLQNESETDIIRSAIGKEVIETENYYYLNTYQVNYGVLDSLII